MESILDNILQLFNEHSRKIATAISIVLIVLMSLTVANTVLFVMETANPATSKPTARPSAKRIAKPTYKVSSLELFGKAESAAAATQVIDAPETKLNLELQGVFIAEDEKRSTAIVGEKNKSGELYEIGDRLPGNATLAAVFVDHVLLRRGSRMEKLMFSDSKYRSADSGTGGKSKSKGVSGASKNIPGTSTSRSTLEQIRNRIRNRTNSEAGLKQPNASSALSEYRQKLKNDPVAALGEIGISAVAEGESKGYRVGDDAQGGIRQAGLQPGDVILSVNGRPVGAAANDSALIDQVMASSRVRVEVKRGSRRFFLTVPVPK